jgi:hypothetical protein
MDLEGEGVPRGPRGFRIAATIATSLIPGLRWDAPFPDGGGLPVVQSAVHGGTIPEAMRRCAGRSMRL